jgi:Ca2+-binding EF-hand superfamily protein
MKKRSVLWLLAAVIFVAVIATGVVLLSRPSPGGPTPDELVRELLLFDKNGDGQLRPDEVPERMQGMFARGDANQDGTLTRDELHKLAEVQNEAARRSEPHNHRDGERR